MKYSKLEVSRDLIRDQIFEYLRDNQRKLIISQPPQTTGSSRIWTGNTEQVGISANKIIDDIFEHLLSKGKAKATNIPVNDSTVMNAFDAFYPLQIKSSINEELHELVRTGILIMVRYKRENLSNFNFKFDFNTDYFILTEYGIHCINDEPNIPYFVKRYIDGLRRIAEPDTELQGYLSEGLACLRNSLCRASIILLRLAAEYTLTKLIESMERSMQEKEVQKLKAQIRKAGINIEERAEVAFRKLESSSELLPSKYSKNQVSNRLRSAFHSIRDLGGKAAHLSSTISLDEVKDHYSLYASSVYSIVMEIIEHQDSIKIPTKP